MRFSFPLTLLALGGLGSCSQPEPPKTYDGHKVYRISTAGKTQAVIQQLKGLELDIWNPEVVGAGLDVVVPADKLPDFLTLGLTACLHDDLGQSIAAESAPAAASWKRTANFSAWFDAYHPYEEHKQFFKDLQAAFPKHSAFFSSGSSYEARDLYGLHIWGAGGPGKPAVLHHATVHAREWIATMVPEYIALQLLTGAQTNNSEVVDALNQFDFYILPIVNPDGFVFSQTTDRLWRKSRQPYTGPGNSTCVGRDINRNWEFAWNTTTGGSSSDPCDPNYAGEAPSDAHENRALDLFMRGLRDTPAGLKAYIDWHSYSQMYLFPFGYDETRLAPQVGKWTRTASMMSETVREFRGSNGVRRGTTMTFGPGGAVLYKSVGCSRDHVYAIGRADFSWSVELPDTGKYGFVLPPDQIRPTVEEQWAAQLVYLRLLNEVFFDGHGYA